MIAIGGETVAEVPMGRFCAFACGDGIDAVGGDGAAIDELDVDTAVRIGDNGVETGEGESGTAESTECETALVVADEGEVAEIGGGGGGGDDECLGGGECGRGG